MRKLLTAVCIAGLLTACGAVPSPSASRSPGSTPTVSPSELPSPNPIPTPSPTPTPSPSPIASPSPPAGFVCSDASGGFAATSTVNTVRVGQHPGYDRITIEFGGGVPSYTVTRQLAATFTRSPRGDQVTLEGNAGVLIVI